MMVGLASMFWIVPFARIAQNDILSRIANPKEKYLAVNSMRMCNEILNALFMLMLGSVMELDIKNFLYVFTINPLVCLGFHLIRRLRERKEMEQVTEEPKSEEPAHDLDSRQELETIKKKREKFEVSVEELNQ